MNPTWLTPQPQMRAAKERKDAEKEIRVNAASKTRQRKAPAEKIRVLIADDHVTVREGLAAMIGRQPDMMVVCEAANGREAVDLWPKHRPDVALLDLRMPLLDGVGAIDEIRRRDAPAPVIRLTTFHTANRVSPP